MCIKLNWQLKTYLNLTRLSVKPARLLERHRHRGECSPWQRQGDRSVTPPHQDSPRGLSASYPAVVENNEWIQCSPQAKFKAWWEGMMWVEPVAINWFTGKIIRLSGGIKCFMWFLIWINRIARLRLPTFSTLQLATIEFGVQCKLIPVPFACRSYWFSSFFPTCLTFTINRTLPELQKVLAINFLDCSYV